jgi:hypothetical protein
MMNWMGLSEWKDEQTIGVKKRAGAEDRGGSCGFSLLAPIS